MERKRDVTVLGAGVMGLTIALELHRRGYAVELRDQGAPGSQASWAAAGMLASGDPHNPPALKDFADFSLRHYPRFLDEIQELSGVHVPFQTDTTVQIMPGGEARRMAEHSLDPRQLLQALLAAVVRANIPLHRSETGAPTGSGVVVHTTGAWASGYGVRPRKGQMLRVKLPPGMPLTEVYRSEHIYVVPRTAGPQAGTALLGATVEDCGFDTAVHPGDLARLRQNAAQLVRHLPALADAEACPMVEAWAGLRPATADGLPLLGELPSPRSGQRVLVATGHFRNGILLAPGTASLISDLVEGRPAAIDLHSFDPARPALAEGELPASFGHTQR